MNIFSPHRLIKRKLHLKLKLSLTEGFNLHKLNKVKWCLAVLLLSLSLLGFFFWGHQNKKQFNYPSTSFFDVYGLDVSHHQGEISWGQVSDEYQFVYIKATEGESFKDKRFLENYRQAKQNGFVVGAYHFWTFCKSAKEQLENMMSVTPVSKGDLVPAIDMESAYSCGKDKEDDQVITDLNEINEVIMREYGKLPVVYTTNEFVKVHPEILGFKNILTVLTHSLRFIPET